MVSFVIYSTHWRTPSTHIQAGNQCNGCEVNSPPQIKFQRVTIENHYVVYKFNPDLKYKLRRKPLAYKCCKIDSLIDDLIYYLHIHIDYGLLTYTADNSIS